MYAEIDYGNLAKPFDRDYQFRIANRSQKNMQRYALTLPSACSDKQGFSTIEKAPFAGACLSVTAIHNSA